MMQQVIMRQIWKHSNDCVFALVIHCIWLYQPDTHLKHAVLMPKHKTKQSKSVQLRKTHLCQRSIANGQPKQTLPQNANTSTENGYDGVAG